MKRYISIICMLVSLVFCQGAFGQDTKLDSLLNMQGKTYEKYKNIDNDNKLKKEYDGLLKERITDFPQIRVSETGESLTVDNPRAIVFEHKSEAYVYVPKRTAIHLVCDDKDLCLYLDKSENSGSRGVGFNENCAIHNEGHGLVLYAAQGNYDRVKFYIKNGKGDSTKKTFYLCFLDNEKYALRDSTKLMSGFESDTLRLNRKDTIDILKVLEPRYSVYHSLELNDKKIDELDSITDYNDPERADSIKIDFKSYWDKLKDGENTLTVKVATFDENCKFAELHSQTYVICVEAHEPFPWLWVILGGAALLGLVAMAVILGINCSNKKKLLQRLSGCKTQICNLQDDESVPCEAKEQLESHSQRVTAAIADLRGRKLLKKAHKQECGKLVDEIEEYMKNLGQQQSDPDPQPQPAPQPDQSPDQKPDPQPLPDPQPQPVSNDELLAKIKELEDKLSKADEDKQAALAEQKDKLDKEHEKAVKDLTEQLEQEHKDELQKQSEKHVKELKEQEAKYLEALETQRNYYERRLRDQEEEHRRQIAEIEADCARRIYAITKELNEVKGKWQEDKKYVVKMYRAYEAGIGDMVESMKSNGDDVAPAYTEMLQIHSESVHSFQSFHDQFQAIMEKELTIAEMREELAKVFSVHIDYERSWINALCRLHAYSKVEKLAPMFGLYNEYKVDISELYVQFLALASILGFENIHVPELFVEEFHSSEAESDNTNLVLPNIYPNYVEALVSSTIYDIHTVGYTYDGTTRKPKVAYYV